MSSVQWTPQKSVYFSREALPLENKEEEEAAQTNNALNLLNQGFSFIETENSDNGIVIGINTKSLYFKGFQRPSLEERYNTFKGKGLVLIFIERNGTTQYSYQIDKGRLTNTLSEKIQRVVKRTLELDLISSAPLPAQKRKGCTLV